MIQWRRIAGKQSIYRARVRLTARRSVAVEVRREELPGVGVLWWGFVEGKSVASGDTRAECNAALYVHLRGMRVGL